MISFFYIHCRDGDGYRVRRLLLGTYISNKEQNYLLIAKVVLPLDIEQEIPEQNIKKFKIEYEIPHQGEVNKARYMPKQPNIIATQPCNGEIHIFDYFKHPKKPEPKAHVKPILKLTEHTEQVTGVSWNKSIRGALVSASEDKKVCYWNIENVSGSSTTPIQKYEVHSGAVRDVSWNKQIPSVFASSGSNGELFVFDVNSKTRVQFNTGPEYRSDIVSVDFNCKDQNYLATGASDGMVNIWDIRRTDMKVRSLEKHKKDIAVVTWSPFRSSVLGTASNDWKVILWDVGQESGDDIKYIHKGHKSFINDLAWSSTDDRLLASSGEDNILQLWQIGEEVFQ